MSTSKFASRFLICAAVGIGVVPAMGAFSARAQGSPPPGAQTPQANPPQNPLPPQTELTTEGVTFAPKMQLDKGQTWRYDTQSSITLRIAGKNGGLSDFSSTITMAIAMRYRVRETRPDGGALIEAASEGGRMLDPSGAFQSLPKDADSAARTLTLDRQARILALSGQTARKNGAGSGLDALFSQSNLLIPLHILPLPDKTIKVGESWTANYAASGKPAGESEASSGIKATLTLLGSEKVGGITTMKIKQALTVPYVAYTDAQGKATEARGAKGRMNMLLTFTQMVNALPDTGMMVRSEGGLTGTIKFEGALLSQLPGDTMTIGGKMVVARLEDNSAPSTAARK